MEGILPLLHTYYSLYFSPKDAPSESLKSQEIETSAQIFNKLLVMHALLTRARRRRVIVVSLCVCLSVTT